MLRKSISIVLMLALAIITCVAQVAVFVAPFTIYAPNKLTVPVVLSNLLPQLRSRPFYRGGFPEVFSGGKFCSSLSRVPGAPDILVQQTIDPETGIATERRIRWEESFVPRQVDFGDKTWLFSAPEETGSVSADEEKRCATWEIVKGEPRTSVLPRIPNRVERLMYDIPRQRFWLDGQPAYLFNANDAVWVDRFDGHTWGHEFEVGLPDESLLDDRDRKFLAKAVDQSIRCLSVGDRVHFFVLLPDKVLYREGLVRCPVPEGADSIERNMSSNGHEKLSSVTDQSVRNQGWIPLKLSGPPELVSSRKRRGEIFAAVVGGKPVVATFDGDARLEHSMNLNVYRCDDSKWFLSETVPLHVNTYVAEIFHQADGERAYLHTATNLGWNHVFAIEPAGVRRTHCDMTAVDFKLPNLRQHLYAILSSSLVLGTVLGIAIWALMWWASTPEFRAANGTVKLASIGRRGMARGLDLVLLLLTTGFIACMLLDHFDWYDFMEAVHSRIAHSTIDWMKLTAFLLFLWVVVWTFFQAALQAWSGRTLGKWCCGIQTSCTTLETIRFPRALLREILFYLDICYGVCFVPGLLCIALTSKRQRIGDLLAGTIVIESQTMSPRGATQDDFGIERAEVS